MFLSTLSFRRKLTAVRLDQKQIKALERIGKRADRPVSWLIRKAIDEFSKRTNIIGEDSRKHLARLLRRRLEGCVPADILNRLSDDDLIER